MVTGSSDIPLNQWVHVAATYDGSHVRAYINGLQDGASTPLTGSIDNNNAPVYIGKSQFYPRNFNGRIDEIRIYDTALSGQEIAALYNEF